MGALMGTAMVGAEMTGGVRFDDTGPARPEIMRRRLTWAGV